MRNLIILLLLVVPNWAFSNPCRSPCGDREGCQSSYYIGNKKIDIYTNFPLDQQNDCIEKVIFVVHGVSRNARSRYKAIFDAAVSVGKEESVLIISPMFKTLDDNPDINDYYWSSHGWKQGNTSNNDGEDISSFSVADNILGNIINSSQFPNLFGAVVTGHSAGGQYAQLFALTSPIVRDFPDIDFSFLVLNPSNYSYLNELRPNPYIVNYFESPVYKDRRTLKMKPLYKIIAGDCPNDYNDYKYGLEERNSYANRFSKDQLITQYLERNVYYYLGGNDNDSDDDLLDTSCEAKLQGSNRLERGQNFFNFLNQYFAGHRHYLDVIEGVSHNAHDMYGSEEIRLVLFN